MKVNLLFNILTYFTINKSHLLKIELINLISLYDQK